MYYYKCQNNDQTRYLYFEGKKFGYFSYIHSTDILGNFLLWYI